MRKILKLFFVNRNLCPQNILVKAFMMFSFMMVINIESEILFFLFSVDSFKISTCICSFSLYCVNNNKKKPNFFLVSSSFEFCLYAGFIYLTEYHLYSTRSFEFYCLVSTKSSEEKVLENN